MLSLTRKKKESIIVELGGTKVEIVVQDIALGPTKKQVQLAISAPPEVAIWRSELYDSVVENRKASEQRVKKAALRRFLPEQKT